jgi:hypothetical protein
MTTDRDFRGRSKGSLAILATLDAMPFAELQDELGPPDQVTTIMREGGAHWSLGDPRPALATEDVAAVQAMARCLAWRASAKVKVNALGGIHPRPCLWCDYPTDELLAAVDWAGWNSGLVEIAYATWHGAYGSHFDRATPAQGTYTNLRWAQFFGSAPSRDEAGRQRRALIEAAAYGGLPV